MTIRPTLAASAAVCLLLLLPAAAEARSAKTMALKWSPTSEIDDAGELDLTGLGGLRFEVAALADERTDRSRIGENREHEPRIHPVSTPDDVPAFVTSGLRGLLERFGLRVVETGGDVVLSGAVRRFFVTEDSTYEGEVALWIVARDREGRLLWEGIVNGTTSRWGREFKAANYCEVLSDSVFDATAKLIGNAAFLSALRDAGRPPAATPGN